MNTFDITSFALPMFAFYLLLAGSYLHDVFGCRLQHIMKNSMIAKHITAILLLFFLIVAVNPSSSEYNIGINFGMTLLIYLWFLITTRCPYPIMIFIILCLFIIYILGYQKDFLSKKNNDEHSEKIKKLQLTQTILGIIALVFSIIGLVLYFIEKKTEHKNKFNFKKFFFGHHLCNKNYSPISY